MDTIARKWAEFAVSLRYEDLPAAVVHQAKRFLFDSIGCALGGYHAPDVQIAHEVYKEMGGKPEATVFGSGWRTSAYHASFLNSLMIRVLDYNDIYWKQDPSHPSDLIAAPLALGEREHKCGRDLITAVVLAYEFEQRLCEFAFPGLRERKWHHASLTQLASPVAAGKMLDLTVDQMVHAIGISGCHNMTLGAVTAGKLTMMKNTVDPLAVQSGVLAALLARQGYTGPEAIFEGKEGLMDTLGGDFAPELLTAGLGDSYRITECAMKAFPTEALTHSPITATLKLVRQHQIRPEEVQEVEVRTIARAVDILADPSKYHPTSKETADHSLPYCIAVAIVDGQVTTTQFHEDRLRDPRLLQLMPKIRVVAAPELEAEFPQKKPAEVIIRTARGTVAERVDYPKGDPREPMTDEELMQKFAALTEGILSENRRKRITDAIWQVEQFETLDAFCALLVVG
ncbi:MAG: MmgE/PrpD family protein [candidate division KSB1 bacterium]|nr:MmgE/PrpD family protein [candidate division KSB1 bacterium]